MAITFENTPLEWNNEGAEPSTDLKANGFVPGYKPAADTFNYQINNSSACLTELQTKLSEVDDTVSELDQNAVRGIRGKGTLITPMSDKTVNITPQGIGAATSSHNHSASNITSGTLPIARGGTGATTASSAISNLGVSGTVLYSNESGTTGTITLSQPYTNFVRIGVYAQGQYDNDSMYNETLTSISYMTLGCTSFNDSNYDMVVWRLAYITFSGNTISFYKNGAAHLIVGSGNYLETITTDGLKITRVVGYNY